MRHSGFTLIELIAVIAILGALAVIALPKFINLQDEAQQASTEGVAGSLGAAAAMNLAAAIAGDTNATSIDDCTDFGGLLAGGMPEDYTIITQDISSLELGDATVCQVENTAAAEEMKVKFTGYAVP